MKISGHLPLLLLFASACSSSTDGLVNTPAADAGALPDAAAPDAALDAGLALDATVPPDSGLLRQAWIYPHDPILSNGQVEQVTLPETSETSGGYLASGAVTVSNCLNEAGGPTSTQSIGGIELTIAFCHEIPTATASADGNYLDIRPPADDGDPNDPFAEVMMYYHVNAIHDYYHGTFGFQDLDYPLPAVVNVQFKIDPPLPFLPVNPDGWSSFPNAAYFPKEAWNQLAAQLGFPPRDQDSIIFGQDKADFAYDASVIYHEYTHAMIGKHRLNARIADQYGLDQLGPSMNEGLADYFAATRLDDPIIGRYGIGKLQASLVRDLTSARRCPDDLTAEVHADGKILSTALWEARGALGKATMDGIVFRAVQQFTETTNLDAAGNLLLAEAHMVGAEAEAAVRAALEAHGVLACEREKPWVEFVASTSAEGLPYPVEGTQSAEVPGFSAWAPAYFGFYVDVPAAKRGATLRWALSPAGGLASLGGPTATPKLALSVRKGAPVELTLLGAPARTEDAFAEPASTATGGGGATQAVTLAPSCIPDGGGRVYVLFVNKQATAANVSEMHLELLDQDPAAGATVVDCTH